MPTDSGICLEITSRFMQNYEQQSPVSDHEEIATGTSADGKVMFFSVGEDNNLYYYYEDDGTDGGWANMNLTENLTGDVHHVGVTQDNHGNPIVAISVIDTAVDADNSLVYHTSDFTAGATDRWIGWDSQPAIGLVQKFAVGVGGVDGKTYLTFAALQNENVTVYFVDANSSTWTPQSVPLPANADAVIDLKIGHISQYEQVMGPGEPPLSQATIYALFEDTSGNADLTLTTMPDAKANHRIPVDDDAASIAVLSDGNGNTNLFVGSKNLYCYDVNAQLSGANTPEATGALLIGSFNEPITTLVYDTNKPNSPDIWARTSEGNLHVTRGRDGSWTHPFIVAKQVSPEIATWKNPSTDTSSLFYVDGDDQLYYLRQDGDSTLWKRSHIKTTLLDDMEEYQSYSIQVVYYNEDGSVGANKNLYITASQATQVIVNSKNYYTDPYTPITAVTDAQGRLTVINRSDELSVANIRFSGDEFTGFAEVIPSSETAANLGDFVQQMLNDPQSVRDMQIKDGHGNLTKVIPEGYDSDANLETAQQALQQLLDMAGQTTNPVVCPTQVRVPDAQSGGNLLVAVAPASPTAFSNELDMAKFENYKWGIDFTTSTPTYLEGDDVDAAMPQAKSRGLGSALDGVEQFAGDVFNALKNELIEITHFVVEKVEDVIRFTVNTIEGVIHFVVETIEQVWQAIEWILTAVLAMTLELIMMVIGFFFDWEGILMTKDSLSQLANMTIDKMIDTADSIKPYISNFFDTLEDKVLGPDLVAQMGDSGDQTVGDSSDQCDETQSNQTDSTTNWVLNQILGGGIFAKIVPDPFDDDNIAGQIFQVLGNLAYDELNTAVDTFGAIAQDIADKMGSASLAEITLDIMQIIAAGLLEELENLILAMIDLVEIVLNAFKDIMNNRLDIPIFTFLYEEIIAPGSELSFLDCICLMGAMPLTVISNVVTGDRPLTDDVMAYITQCFNAATLPPLDDEVAAKTSRHTHSRTTAAKEVAAPSDAAVKASYILGGVGVPLFRMIGGAFANVGALPEVNKFGIFRGFSAGVSLVGYAVALSNLFACCWEKPVGDTAEESARLGFERGLTIGQFVFPLMGFIGAFPISEPLKAGLGGGKVSGAITTAIAGIALYIWEMTDEGIAGDDDMGAQMGDSSLKVTATATHGLWVASAYPAVALPLPYSLACIALIAFGSVATGLITTGRGDWAFIDKRMLSPI